LDCRRFDALILPTRTQRRDYSRCKSTRPQFRVGIFIIISKDIMTNKKYDCVHYLANRFQSNSAWRSGQFAKFPNDTRNARAAQRLLELESGIEISDALWDKLSPYYNESDTRWLAAVSETNRDVGFRKHPRDFAAWVENLLSNLTRN
jgi:hypothetical protein